MANATEYNFHSWKNKNKSKEELKIVKKYDTTNPPEYKLHLQYPQGWRILTYKPHTSELLDENGRLHNLSSINSTYQRGHF
ncbi:hypothetical protein EB001_17605, partial [bacterium]|nr:hypothetical protein [bacterium]